MPGLEKNRIYRACIQGYSSEGLGIARVNGAVVFVPHAVRGEEIDLRITKVMKTSCAGEIVKIHNPSPERMEPECPYAGKCGGCAYRHLTYPEELWAKRQRVQDALTRIGGLELTVEEILGAKNPEHYRNKSQYPVGADGSIGFFQARTHKVVPIRRCLIQTEAADRTAQAVGEWMRRYKISTYDETTGKGLVRHVCVRVNKKGESLCCLVVNGGKVPREPELADIDRRLRGTMSQIITRALKGGRDPVPAIHAIRDENLALQRRRGEILAALGCPADYLEDNRYILRPANFSGRMPGRGCGVYDCGKLRIAVMTLIGRCDLDWKAADPFTTADKLLRDGRVRLKDCKSAKGKTYNATVLLGTKPDGRSKFSLEFEGSC